ncbi:hypothetical protein SCHPADRAFT_227771 [Schizopora paradoxa]|uniref:Uncharacterized protein n=1 Tax=Schizopora paradoxa TaxID=27342 RepID=A0A0H2RWU4_9AGAM|nr:hypothetical protein SCHPADRAFT_227771 [Schizopora paradoxa]
MFAPFPGALSTFNQGLISIILVLRTYALYGQNRYVLLATSSAGIVNVVISAWASSAMTGSLFSFQPLVSCVPILQVPQLDRLRYGWIATFAFDFLIFSLTFGRALKLMRTESNKRETVSLARLIVRDGSLYFLVMSIVNALNFVFFLKVTNALFSSTTGTNSMIAHV